MNSIALRIRIFIVGVILTVSVVSGFAFEIQGPEPPIILRPPLPPWRDATPPIVSITSPSEGYIVTAPEVIVTGVASDSSEVAGVQFRVENGAGISDYKLTSGTTSWSADATGLVDGTNTVRINAWDNSGNATETTVNVYFLQKTPLAVIVNGVGSLKPSLNGQILETGTAFKITEKPGKGYVFAGWTGDVTAGDIAQNFIMRSNMVLQANFVPTPFVPVVGTYQGDVTGLVVGPPELSGSFTTKITKDGKFTGKVRLNKKSYSFSGALLADGSYSGSVLRKGLPSIMVHFQLDLNTRSISGVFTDLSLSSTEPTSEVVATLEPKRGH